MTVNLMTAKYPGCLVCGMKVENEQIKSTFIGEEYLFCCGECRRRFEKYPEKYIYIAFLEPEFSYHK